MTSNIVYNYTEILNSKGFAPQLKGEHIHFTYNYILMYLTRIDRFRYKLMIPDVTNTERKNKAYIQKLINETYEDCQNGVKITIESDTVNMFVIDHIYPKEEFKNSFNHYLDILQDTYHVFMQKIINRYGTN